MKMLSQHFADSEFGDSASGVVPVVSELLLIALEQYRKGLNELYGKINGKVIERKVLITSGYRDPKHNAETAGAAQHSQHMTNPLTAVDVVVPGLHLLDALRVAYLVDAFVAGGIGLYPQDGHLHLDVRPGGPARWIS